MTDKTIEIIAEALRLAQIDTCKHLSDNAIIVAPLGFPYDEVCGLPVVVVATQSHLTLGNCDYKITCEFENIYSHLLFLSEE